MLEFKRVIQTNVILKNFTNLLVNYPTSASLNYLWNFGSLAVLCLLIQILTGIFLAMHYVPHADLAFLSVEHIMRDVNNGWLLRYIHANGASFFFLVVYIHVFRGIFHASYVFPRHFLWCSGVIILLLMILTAFLGYVLPWGQMSFWAATVITNLASAIPFVGNKIVFWLWGGFAVDNATLNRFFSLHYLLPFIISALAILHIVFLHEHGSSNPIGLTSKNDMISFNPYFIVKDFFGFWVFFILFFVFVFFYPNVLGHTDNYIPANPLVTPTHIVPEWYFLPFYAILRSIPDKLMGVVSLLNSILILLVLPFLFENDKLNKSVIHLNYHRFIFWLFFFNCLVLGWIGGKSIETPYYEIGQLATLFYFLYFFSLFLFDLIVASRENVFWSDKFLFVKMRFPFNMKRFRMVIYSYIMKDRIIPRDCNEVTFHIALDKLKIVHKFSFLFPIYDGFCIDFYNYCYFLRYYYYHIPKQGFILKPFGICYKGRYQNSPYDLNVEY